MIKLILSLLLLLPIVTPGQQTIAERFKAPAGYVIKDLDKNSFGYWLRNLPLKPIGTHTKTYNGQIARTDAYTAAVVDMSVGKYDLQQCADAVMRLRAEYLYNRKDYQAIHFNFTSGFNYDFIHFANGYRYHEPGKWGLSAKKDHSYKSFMQYMNLMFTYAGTLSLEKELKKVSDPNGLQEGDVFIHGGSPGHCFIVLEVATDKNGQKKFLLAQSFMPAQNIQVLKQVDGPWFDLHSIAEIPYGNLVSPTYLKKF